MARQTKRGICELCGAHTNVGMNHGSKACPACTHVQTALNKRPEAVAKAIRAMHKTEEMLGHLIPAGGLAVKVTADLLQEISGIVGYEGEDPGELVAAVRKSTALAAHQLISEAETGALRTIAGIVGYDGTDGSEVVEAVRKRVLTCASCDSEDVLHEIREIVGYVPEQGDKGLADAVRAFADRRPAYAPDCAECDAANALLEIAELVGKRGASSGLVVEAVKELVERAATLSATGNFLRGDLLRACGLERDNADYGEGWAVAALAAIQEIAELVNHCGDLLRQLTRERADNAQLHLEVGRLNGQTRSESEEMTALREDLDRSTRVIEELRAELTLAHQARDEWESRAVQAESNVELLEAEMRNREAAPAVPCASTTYLLDIALKALRGEGPDADQLATLIDAARRVA